MRSLTAAGEKAIGTTGFFLFGALTSIMAVLKLTVITDGVVVARVIAGCDLRRSEDLDTTCLAAVLSDHTTLAPRPRPSFLTTRHSVESPIDIIPKIDNRLLTPAGAFAASPRICRRS